MENGGIDPRYRVTCESGIYSIEGTEKTTGDTVSIKLASKSRAFADELAELLSDKKVSVCHAKDVVRDMLLEFLDD